MVNKARQDSDLETRLRGLGRRAQPWAGTALAGATGVVLGGPVGLVAGGAAGLLLDRHRVRLPFRAGRWRRLGSSAGEAAMLACLFAWAGLVAKADGRVSEAEIATTRSIMRELELDVQRRALAIDVFNHAKKGSFPRRLLARRLVGGLGGRPERLRHTLAHVVRVAAADGRPAEEQIRLVQQLGLLLGFSSAEVSRYLKRSVGPASGHLRTTLEAAFHTLDIPETASDREVRHAYRRMISRHHPDRMVAQGLSDAEIRAATTRTHTIREAYESIKRARGVQ